MGKLIVASECKLQGDSECLDRHDRYGTDGRADRYIDERIVLAVNRRDFVYHDGGEDDYRQAVDNKPCSSQQGNLLKPV